MQEIGYKQYELSNHLGNVLAVVSDKKEQANGVWQAVVISAKDYYPFGMSMPSRTTEGGTYRYGFNGKENDQETGIQDYGMRWYLPNICRFPSVDPLTQEYSWYTPYQFAGNMPIQAIDLDGTEPKITITNEETGYTLIKVYGMGNIKVMLVPTYYAKISYLEKNGSETFLGSFHVTRDGWYDHGTQSNGSSLLINRSSDPTQTVTGEIRGQGIKYGDAPVYIFPDFYAPIANNQTTFTNGTPLSEDMQRADGNASGAMLHIGGFYKSGSKTSLGGTYGCYGVVDPSQVLLRSQATVLLEDYKEGKPIPTDIIPSNNEMQRVGDLIEEKRKTTWFGLSKESVLFEIQKRDKYETKQDAY